MAVCVIHGDQRIGMANPAACGIFGLSTLVGCRADEVLPGSGAVIGECLDQAERGEIPVDRQFCVGNRHFLATFLPGNLVEGRSRDLVVMALEITRQVQVEHILRQSRRRLMAKARCDHLTGLLNRRGLDLVLGREVRRSTRMRRPLSLLAVDIDWFKAYNDTLGHPQGDACLRAVAQALTACIRRGGDVACRYGGEEFVLILPETNARGAAVVAANCQQAIANLQLAHPGSPLGRISASIGIAEMGMDPPPGWPPVSPGEAARTLLARADGALYQAKHEGRNCVSMCSQA